jgi:transcriptional/translational regulatory protein YebC/TACO1
VFVDNDKVTSIAAAFGERGHTVHVVETVWVSDPDIRQSVDTLGKDGEKLRKVISELEAEGTVTGIYTNVEF